MNMRMLLLLSISCCVISLSCMQTPQYDLSEADISFRQADEDDVAGVLELINTQAIYDRTKIVILPKKFREASLRSAIKKGHIYVAQVDGKIVGYKKLFLMNNPDEKSGILQDEIRCLNNKARPTFAGSINADGEFIADNSVGLPHDCFDVCLYNGGDFTLPSHRRKGINKQLTNGALLSLMTQVKKQIQDQNAKAISMVYGITEANAGDQPGAASDRTPSISKSFKAFIQSLEENRDNRVTLQHRRYRAFMPTFDPESHELKPLPDDQAIAGFGCVLAYQLKGSHE